ncbi:hypothetical protein BC830DRAFT_409692 [Chytriomyces sp. MP71]|nr:hypothetical protein BC830DRAFT_409692 [Chytriomyces sp. MP71]
MKTALLSAVAALAVVSSVSAYSKWTNADGTISTDVPFRCGSDWFDADKYCYKACPNGKDGECGYGQRCYRDLQNECDSYKDEDYGYDDKKKEYKPKKEYKKKPKTKEYYHKPTTTEDYYDYEKTTTEEYYEQPTTAYGYKSTHVYYQATTTKGYNQAPTTVPSYKKSGKLMKAHKENKYEKKYEKKYTSDDSEQGYTFESTLQKGLYLSVSSYGGKLECKSEAR